MDTFLGSKERWYHTSAISYFLASWLEDETESLFSLIELYLWILKQRAKIKEVHDFDSSRFIEMIGEIRQRHLTDICYVLDYIQFTYFWERNFFNY